MLSTAQNFYYWLRQLFEAHQQIYHRWAFLTVILLHNYAFCYNSAIVLLSRVQFTVCLTLPHIAMNGFDVLLQSDQFESAILMHLYYFVYIF